MRNKSTSISLENLGEAIKAIKDNKLRTGLTVSIVAVGIMSLIGILTAIDGIERQVVSGMSELGGNSFSIQNKTNRKKRRQGRSDKIAKPITFRNALFFKKKFRSDLPVSISTQVTGSAEIKYGSKKTNPNTSIIGSNENYLEANGRDLKLGRNFSALEGHSGANVALLGEELVKTLFEDKNPLGEKITLYGTPYKIIGTLKAKGGLGGGASDRTVIIPIINANVLGNKRQLNYTITIFSNDPTQLEKLMGEAQGVMRIVKQDKPGANSSFEVTRNESVADSMNSITGSLRLAAFGIGAITLLGAAIGLMNIMLVSVTERTREIGVRKSLGAAPKHIKQQFLVEAIVICQLGGGVGIILGIIIGNVITIFMSQGKGFVFVIPWLWMFIGLLVCMVVGTLSGFYPANRAAKLDPIESLRYE